jgi:3'-phosphoadenosine 5'-phosphosulfate sulfotransferase (PAPS reductase)/FAD synthetase
MRHIVALSGGKDSTAMALRLREVEPDTAFEYVITPTGDELPEMIEHWRKVSEMLGSKLTALTSGYSLNSLIASQRAIPNNRMRWCTRMLEIEPFKKFMCSVAPATTYVGLRADEEGREGAVYGNVEGITQRFPLREWRWKKADVLQYLESRGVEIPARTDCARCFYQRLGEWWNLWRDHPTLFADAERQEADIGHTFRTEGRDSWPVQLVQLRGRFESGDRPADAGQLGLFERAEMCRACSL